jgi:RimJ/RimL family protein N-acetyltransferase
MQRTHRLATRSRSQFNLRMNPVFDPQPATLTGQTIRLEPLSLAHAADLFQAGVDRTIWTYMPIAGFPDLASVQAWIEKSQANAATGAELPFAIIHLQTNQAVGSTRYMDIRQEHRAVEIGWTWLAPGVQRTRVNTEAKYLLLTHAFETLGAHRVQLKTDARNLRSQRAIERLGAVLEGRHRRHMVMWDGHVRDTVFFSILDHEWPEVKRRLQLILNSQSPSKMQ